MKLYFAAVFISLSALSATQAAAQTKRALLIGIDTYQPAGTQAQHPAGCTYGRCELGAFENLDGAVNDARAMADLLTSPKFGFPADKVVLLTNPAEPHPRPGVVVLPAEQTSRDGILGAMQKYLVDLPQRGDTVVFYDASHGSLRVNSKGNKLTVLVNGNYVHADSTLVPADAYKGGFDVRDREITRIFNAALDKGIHLTAIFDSCHSGGISRGIGPKYRERSLAFDSRDIAEAPELLANGQPRPAPTERTDNPALVLSAAQQDQTAKEMPVSATATEAHGAFTAALIEALQALPVATPAAVVYQRVKAVLEGGSVPDQEPDLDATAARRRQPLFGGAAADSSKVRAAALQTDEDGSVWLDIGSVSGIGVGSEFTSMIPDSKGRTVTLRVTSLEGIARSSAAVVSPAGAKVAPGEVFELTKWSPAESAPLRVWHWSANLSQDEILAAATQVAASGAALVSDPAEEPWTHILCWDGTNWTLQQAGVPAPVSLGAPLTAQALKQHLPAGAKLWVNLPPSRELAARLAPDDRNSAFQAVPDLAGAHYALAGVLTADGPAYAWFHKSELAAGPPASVSALHSPGCSATSQYPVRSDWVPIAGASALDQGGAALNKFASLLAKVHGWLELANSPADASTAGYYSLALVPASGQTPLTADEPARQGDLLKLALQSTDRVVDKRWVYILDIDCHGRGSVLYPGNYAENQFPNAADSGRQFVLPGARTLRIGPPYGVDTLILLSTAQPLPDPYALNFEGVAQRGSRGMESPLQRLLNETSGGTRGFSGEVPTNWGIGLITIRSVPKDAAK
ncbi:MAG: caspase family protein [Terracidiphilus sp.]